MKLAWNDEWSHKFVCSWLSADWCTWEMQTNLLQPDSVHQYNVIQCIWIYFCITCPESTGASFQQNVSQLILTDHPFVFSTVTACKQNQIAKFEKLKLTRPRKANMEPPKGPLEKRKDIYNPAILGCHVHFRVCICKIFAFGESLLIGPPAWLGAIIQWWFILSGIAPDLYGEMLR